jgi:hypothetical protein
MGTELVPERSENHIFTWLSARENSIAFTVYDGGGGGLVATDPLLQLPEMDQYLLN